MQERVRALGQPDPGQRQEALEEAIQALQITLEEVKVTNEILNLQNEELALMHRNVDAERKRYQAYYESLPVASLITGPAGEILEVTRTACQVFRLAPEQLKRHPLIEYVSEEARAEFRSLLERLLEEKRPENVRITFRPRVRKPFSASVRVSAVETASGAPDAFQWIIREVKELDGSPLE